MIFFTNEHGVWSLNTIVRSKHLSVGYKWTAPLLHDLTTINLRQLFKSLFLKTFSLEFRIVCKSVILKFNVPANLYNPISHFLATTYLKKSKSL